MKRNNPEDWRDDDEGGRLWDELRPLFVFLAAILIVLVIAATVYINGDRLWQMVRPVLYYLSWTVAGLCAIVTLGIGLVAFVLWPMVFDGPIGFSPFTTEEKD